MLFKRDLKIPANTPRERPVEIELTIDQPVIQRIGVFFPPGCHGLAYAAIFIGNLQIWPARVGEWVSGDFITIWDEPYLLIPNPPQTLRILGYNLDEAYPHTLTFYIMAVSKAIGLWQVGIARLVAAITKLFRLMRII